MRLGKSLRNTGFHLLHFPLNNRLETSQRSLRKVIGRAGLGIGIVEAMIKRFGGRLDIDSVEDEGTSVTLWLHVADADADADVDEGEPDDQMPMPMLNVLIAEDDPTLSLILTRFLELDGHEVIAVDDGIAALEEYQKESQIGSFDIIIADLAMPNMNGDELAKRIKALDPKQKLILATSSLDIGSLTDESAESVKNFDFILLKPVTKKSLREAICDVMGKNELAKV